MLMQQRVPIFFPGLSQFGAGSKKPSKTPPPPKSKDDKTPPLPKSKDDNTPPSKNEDGKTPPPPPKDKDGKDTADTGNAQQASTKQNSESSPQSDTNEQGTNAAPGGGGARFLDKLKSIGGGDESSSPNDSGGLGAAIDNVVSRVLAVWSSIPVVFNKLRDITVIRHVYNAVVLLFQFVVLLTIVYIIIFLITKAHLRLFQLYRHADFETFFEKYVTDFELIVLSLSKTSPDTLPSVQGSPDALLAHVKKLAESATLKEDFEIYVKLQKPLKAPTNPVNKTRIFMTTDRFIKTGELDMDAVNAFVTDVCMPIEGIIRESERLSDELNASVDGAGSAALRIAAEFRSHVHTLRLLCSYLPDIESMSVAHGDSSKGIAALWFESYGKLIEDWFEETIPEMWKKTPKKWDDAWNLALEYWALFGQIISKIPCSISYLDEAERQKHCGGGEGFVASPPEEGEEKEVREGFIQFLVSIAEFFQSLLAVAQAVAQIFIEFPKNPVGSIIHLLCIFMGTILGLGLILMYALSTILGGSYLFALMWAFFYAIGIPILITVFYVLLSVLLSIPFIIFFLIDLFLQGTLYKLLVCERLPSEWAENANYAYDNRFRRSMAYLGLVMRPCPRRFRPLFGPVCVRHDSATPDFCPQQQVFKISKKIALAWGHGPYVFDRHRSHKHVMFMRPKEKVEIVRKSYANKQEWNEQCNNTFSKYDYLIKDICVTAMRAEVDKSAPMAEEDRRMLHALCRDSFCSDATRASATSFCADPMNAAAPIISSDNSDPLYVTGTVLAILKKACIVGMITFAVIFFVTTLLSMERVVVDETFKFKINYASS